MTAELDSRGDTVFVSYARTILDYLTSVGVDISALLASAGLRQEDVDDGGRTISAETYGLLWSEAARMTGDDSIGLRVGQLVQPAKYGVLGYVMMSCSTLGESLSRQIRYQDLIGKSGKTQLLLSEGRCELRWHSRLSRLTRHVGEEHLASWVSFARWMTGETEKGPLSVCFEHERPASIAEHERLFRCPLLFEQEHTGLVFPSNFLEIPLRNKNEEMRQLMDRHAEAMLAQHVQNEDQIGQDVRSAIIRYLAEGPPPIHRVAADLGVPVRTLQHRLALTGRSYKDLLDDVRRRLAMRYISDPNLDLPEITFLLGFSEQSSFQRAFKRWTGMPPGQYRATPPDAKAPRAAL